MIVDKRGERSIKDADHQGITAYVSQYYTMRNATLGTKHVFVGTTRMASKLTGGMTYLRGKSGKPTTPVPPPGGEPTGPGQGTLHRSAQAAAHAQNTLKNPHYADPNLPLTVVQENTQIDNPAYSDWEYAFPESYDVATLGGGSEHLYFYHADHLGSTGYVTREDAALVEHVQYFPFGETWIQEGKHTERYPYLFTSKELDEESGLYYFGARYYDPRTSVWQSPDPILGEYLPNLLDEKQKGEDWKPERDLPGSGGVFAAENQSCFSYVGHRPVTFIDPDGKEKNEVTLVFVGGVKAYWGTDPDGNSFFGFRPSLGADAGYSLDADGTSPGFDHRSGSPTVGVNDKTEAGIGLSGDVGISLFGIFNFGYSEEVGLISAESGAIKESYHDKGTFGSSVGGPAAEKIGVGGSAGIDVYFRWKSDAQ